MHCTKYGNVTSSVATVTASIIQESGIGPPSYLITAADLRPTRAGNDIVKYADDTYLIIPAGAKQHTGMGIQQQLKAQLL